MKMLSKILVLSIAIIGSSYSMNKEEAFKADVAQLRKPVADFVNDFATWPKEEKDKIKIFNNEYGRGYVIDGKPAAADKYNGNIGYYLDCRLDEYQIGHFLSAVDYLKTKK